MLVVLDANEYIFTFGRERDPACEALIDALARGRVSCDIRICRTIVAEVIDNLQPDRQKDYLGFILSVTEIDEDYIVPFETGNRYEARGFKPADAFIAAYAEHTDADFLISENRHFLSRGKELPFNVVTAEGFLRIMKLL